MIDVWVKADSEETINSLILGHLNVLGPKLSGGYYYACIKEDEQFSISDSYLCTEKDGVAVLGTWLEKQEDQTTVMLKGGNLSELSFSIANTAWLPNVGEDSVVEYKDVGVNAIRVAIKWDYLQPTKQGAFSSSVLFKLKRYIGALLDNGIVAIIDIHSYAKHSGLYFGEEGGPVQADFVDLWTRLASEFIASKNVHIGLMNEPVGSTFSVSDWATVVQAGITAIRSVGFTGYIHVEGPPWSNAHAFVSGGWAAEAINLTDSLDKIIYQVHTYLDTDNAGNSSEIAYEGVGVARLTDVTAWAKTNGKKLFLGEIGCASTGVSELRTTLQYMEDNSDVWVGWTYWAFYQSAGWWGSYMFLAKIGNEQMNVIEEFL